MRQNHYLLETIELLAQKRVRISAARPDGSQVRGRCNRSIDLTRKTNESLQQLGENQKAYRGDEVAYTVRGREIRVPLYSTSLSHSKIPKISLPKFTDPADIYRWLRKENLPGYFPYTGGVFPLKRTGEDPTRMFAGEGGPAQTNRTIQNAVGQL